MPKKKSRKKAVSKKYASRKATKNVIAKKTSAKRYAGKKSGPKKSSPKKHAVKTSGAQKFPSARAVPKGSAIQKQLAALQQLSQIDVKAMKQRAQADHRLAGLFKFVNKFVEASEYEIIEMMVHSGVWHKPIPKKPDGKGNVEFGLLPYWLRHPGKNGLLVLLADVWKTFFGLPVARIDTVNYDILKSAVKPGQRGLVAADGTWVSESTYGQLDPLWLEAMIGYLYYYLYCPLHNQDCFAPFAQNPATVTLKGASSSQVKIALVGDWGTGPYTNGPAASVMSAITGLKPDYIIHVGDVYYAGLAPQEQSNLLARWPSAYSGKSFTLNSNHEMYDGANGYYQTALANSIFSAQRQTSYFVLQYGNPPSGGPWSIIGLDSAYWSTWLMVMDGSIVDTLSNQSGATAQPQFLQTLVQGGLSPQNAIVLTHHNPISYDGSSLVIDVLNNNLWAQVTGANGLNGTPAAWYWGHVHNGIVYPNPTYTKNNFYGRCLGHGALPFGNASGINAPSSQVQAYANTPRPNPNPTPLMMNGFVMLTITTGGQVTETFYQQDGTQAPWVKPNPFTYQLGKTGAAAAGGS